MKSLKRHDIVISYKSKSLGEKGDRYLGDCGDVFEKFRPHRFVIDEPGSFLEFKLGGLCKTGDKIFELCISGVLYSQEDVPNLEKVNQICSMITKKIEELECTHHDKPVKNDFKLDNGIIRSLPEIKLAKSGASIIHVETLKKAKKCTSNKGYQLISISVESSGDTLWSQAYFITEDQFYKLPSGILERINTADLKHLDELQRGQDGLSRNIYLFNENKADHAPSRKLDKQMFE